MSLAAVASSGASVGVVEAACVAAAYPEYGQRVTGNLLYVCRGCRARVLFASPPAPHFSSVACGSYPVAYQVRRERKRERERKKERERERVGNRETERDNMNV